MTKNREGSSDYLVDRIKKMERGLNTSDRTKTEDRRRQSMRSILTWEEIADLLSP